MKMVTLAK